MLRWLVSPLSPSRYPPPASALSRCRIRAHPELNVVDGATPSARHGTSRHDAEAIYPTSPRQQQPETRTASSEEKSRNNRKPRRSRALPLCIHTVALFFPRTAFAFVTVQELQAPSSMVMWSWEEVDARKRFLRETRSRTDVKCLGLLLLGQHC
jgi:hypothetical protein